MSEETRAVFDAGLGRAILAGKADRAKLTELARAHVDASPPLAELLAAYQEATAALADGIGSNDAVEAAAYHMVPVRQATAILAGAFPDSAPVVTADQTVSSNGKGA